MAGSVRQIIEVPCTVEALERSEALSQLAPEALTALGAESIDGDALGVEAAARVDAAIEACLAAYDPRGVYKLFNPAICTLPPEYSEPAIKLVGTMMMFHGQSVYERLRRAAHCALMAVTIGPDNPAALPADEAAAFAATLDKLYHRSKTESRAGFPHFQKECKTDDEA